MKVRSRLAERIIACAIRLIVLLVFGMLGPPGLGDCVGQRPPTGPAPMLLGLIDLDGILGPDLVVLNSQPSSAFQSTYNVTDGFPLSGSVSVLSGAGDGRFWLSSETLLYREVESVAAEASSRKYERSQVACVSPIGSGICTLGSNGAPTVLIADSYLPYMFAVSAEDGPPRRSDDSRLKQGPIPGIRLLNEDALTRSGSLADLSFKRDGTTSLAAGDIDGDGKTDLAVANTEMYTVTLYRGSGEGNYAPFPGGEWVIGTAGDEPALAAIGDVNGDRKQDILVAKAGKLSREIVIILGNGDGTFSSPLLYPVTSRPRSLLLADFTNDLRPDVVVAGLDGGLVLLQQTDAKDEPVFVKKPIGSLVVAPEQVEGSFAAIPIGLASADYNADGKLDLAVANSGNDCIDVYIGNGSGGFQKPVTYCRDAGITPLCILSGDVDIDGDVDLVVSGTQASSVFVLLNDGAGRFALASSEAPTDVEAMAVGSFSGVDALGLVLSQPLRSEPRVVTQTTSSLCCSDPLKQRITFIYDELRPSSMPGNCDLPPDLVTVSDVLGTPACGSFPVWLSGAGTGDQCAASPLEHTWARALYGADLNSDGTDEFVALWADSDDVSVCFPESNSVSWTTLSGGRDPADVCSGDFNADGRIDLAVANSGSNNVSIYYSLGNRQFSEARIPVSDVPASLAAGDFSGDGIVDLAVGCSRGIYIIPSARSGGSTKAEALLLPVGIVGWSSLVAENLDGAGVADLAVLSLESGWLSILLNPTREEKTRVWSATAASHSLSGRVSAIAAVDLDDKSMARIVAAVPTLGILILGLDTGGVFGVERTVSEAQTLCGAKTTFDSVRAIVRYNQTLVGYGAVAQSCGDCPSMSVFVVRGLGPQCLLTYEAGSGGTIIGPSSQLVEKGGDGSRVVAEPDEGYYFVQWDDGQKAPERQDRGVTKDARVRAVFAVGPIRDQILDAATADLNADGVDDLVLLVALQQRDAEGVELVTIFGPALDPGSRRITSVPTPATAIATGDIDGDGRVDIALANTSQNSITTLWGRGDGGFDPGSTDAVLTAPSILLAGIAEGRGLAIGAQGLDLLMPRAGNHRQLERITIEGVHDVVGMSSGDITGDGIAELVVVCADKSVSAFLGTDLADVTSRTPVKLTLVQLPGPPSGVAVGVSTGDSTGTIAATVLDANLAVLLRGPVEVQSTGSLESASCRIDRPLVVTIANLNHDPYLDVVVAGGWPTRVSIIWGVPWGRRTPSEDPIQSVAGTPRRILEGDWNGDGKTDLALVTERESHVHVLYNSDGATAERWYGGVGVFSCVFVPTDPQLSEVTLDGILASDGSQPYAAALLCFGNPGEEVTDLLQRGGE